MCLTTGNVLHHLAPLEVPFALSWKLRGTQCSGLDGAGIAVNGTGPRHLEGSNTNMSVWDIYIYYIDGLDIELTCWNLKSCWN